MNAKEVELAVVNYFGARQNLIIPNITWGFSGLYYEADLIVVTRAGYAKEIEIKVSKADLIKDKEKKHAHDYIKFNELYFAIPEKLLKYKEHIPEKAGILICKTEKYGDSIYYKARLEKKAISNGVEPLTLKDKYELARLGTLRIWNLKRKLLKHK